MQEEQRATLTTLHAIPFILGKHVDAVFLLLFFLQLDHTFLFLGWCSLVTENPQALLLIFLVSAVYTLVCRLFKNSLISLNTT